MEIKQKLSPKAKHIAAKELLMVSFNRLLILILLLEIIILATCSAHLTVSAIILVYTFPIIILMAIGYQLYKKKFKELSEEHIFFIDENFIKLSDNVSEYLNTKSWNDIVSIKETKSYYFIISSKAGEIWPLKKAFIGPDEYRKLLEFWRKKNAKKGTDYFNRKK